MAHSTSSDLEIVDVYDSNFNIIGRCTRKDAIAKKLLFRSFHCWMTSNGDAPSVIFQRRGLSKSLYPNLFDVALAGHYAAGEDLGGIVREASEELRFALRREGLRFIGRRLELVRRVQGTAFQFNDLYFYDLENFGALCPIHPEVSDVYRMNFDAALKLFSKQEDTAEAINLASTADGPARVTREDFVPRHDQYYLTTLLVIDFLRKNGVWELNNEF